MPVELSQLMELAAGKRPALQVGDLPRPVAEYLRCHPAIVYLGPNELMKIARKHDEITRPEFQQLPFMIDRGSYYTDPKRLDCVTLIGRLLEGEGFYMAGLKATARGGEVWLQTFHRTHARQMERIARQRDLIFQGR